MGAMIHCWMGLDWVNSWGSRSSLPVLAFQHIFQLPLCQWHIASMATPLEQLIRCMMLKTLELTTPYPKQMFITRNILRVCSKWHKINSLWIVRMSICASSLACALIFSPAVSCRGKRGTFSCHIAGRTMGSPFFLFAMVQEEHFLIKIGRNIRISFPSGEVSSRGGHRRRVANTAHCPPCTLPTSHGSSEQLVKTPLK